MDQPTTKQTQLLSGMGFVAAMLLTYFPEEEAFHMLALVMKGPRPAAIRGIYLPGAFHFMCVYV